MSAGPPRFQHGYGSITPNAGMLLMLRITPGVSYEGASLPYGMHYRTSLVPLRDFETCRAPRSPTPSSSTPSPKRGRFMEGTRLRTERGCRRSVWRDLENGYRRHVVCAMTRARVRQLQHEPPHVVTWTPGPAPVRAAGHYHRGLVRMESSFLRTAADPATRA